MELPRLKPFNTPLAHLRMGIEPHTIDRDVRYRKLQIIALSLTLTLAKAQKQSLPVSVLALVTKSTPSGGQVPGESSSTEASVIRNSVAPGHGYGYGSDSGTM